MTSKEIHGPDHEIQQTSTPVCTAFRDYGCGCGWCPDCGALKSLHPKLPPGSPAGETASRLTFDLTKPEQMIAASGAVEALHDAGFRGAAGSAKCVVCRDFESNIREWIEQLGGNPDVQHISLELERLIDVVAPSVRPSAPEAAAAERRWSMTYGDLVQRAPRLAESIQPHEWDNMNISEQRDWVVARSAAPIAPAAEDEFITIRKSTLRRLREVIQAEIRTIDDALLARAEEGANNA